MSAWQLSHGKWTLVSWTSKTFLPGSRDVYRNVWKTTIEIYWNTVDEEVVQEGMILGWWSALWASFHTDPQSGPETSRPWLMHPPWFSPTMWRLQHEQWFGCFMGAGSEESRKWIGSIWKYLQSQHKKLDIAWCHEDHHTSTGIRTNCPTIRVSSPSQLWPSAFQFSSPGTWVMAKGGDGKDVYHLYKPIRYLYRYTIHRLYIL